MRSSEGSGSAVTARPITRRRRQVAVAALAIGGAVAVVLAVRRPGRLDVPTAVLLGLVEGVTEFLPVSSTGHLTVVERLLDLRSSAADAYVIVIQGGAIAAVLVLYRHRLRVMIDGLVGRDEIGRRLGVAVAVAFVPAAAIGLAFGDVIKGRLFGVGPVAAAWAVGGLAILLVGRRLGGGGVPLEALGWPQAAAIGVAQAVGLWPGVSRSLVTIVAGVAIGLSLSAAVEFSFLLGFVTLGAATALEAVQQGGDIVRTFGVTAPVVGFVVAFAAAVVSVRWMVGFLEHGSFALFGIYRLGVAAAALVLLAAGVL